MNINILIDRINDAAASNEALLLTNEEVKVLSKDVGKLRQAPVYSMDQLSALIDAGVIKTQPMVKKA